MEKDSENQLESMMEDDRDSEGAETVAPPGGSAERPLRVKFKFPNMKESAEEDMEDDTQVKSHYCVVCKKRFSSGKALGGHMSSAHVQANRDFSLKKLKYKMKRQQKKLLGFPSGYGGINTCKICGKEFPTIKSLFGHMRCHPDRDWRGMEPPAEAAIDFPATTDPEFEAMNGVPSHVYGGDKIDSGPVVASAVGPKGPLRWLVRAKRGRLPIKSVIDSSPLPSSEEILAVQQLALGLQNQCHCTGECNHTDQVLASRDEAKKERKVLKFDLNELPDQDDEDGMDSGNTAR
ncbi:uncharacterized protein Fot_17347 [Forsythia ovata]|uniref:C2H2-type domain-containing protein n=1 Tax=Forsythia ovata TaxID=205694 RepID=A0ABD1VFD8_9LAMI